MGQADLEVVHQVTPTDLQVREAALEAIREAVGAAILGAAILEAAVAEVAIRAVLEEQAEVVAEDMAVKKRAL